MSAGLKGESNPATTTQRITCLTDILATVSEIIAKRLPKGAAQGSFSSGFFAIRRGLWKLVLANGSGGRQPPRGKSFEKPSHLYNLEETPSETQNLISKNPDLAASLEHELFVITRGDHIRAKQKK